MGDAFSSFPLFSSFFPPNITDSREHILYNHLSRNVPWVILKKIPLFFRRSMTLYFKRRWLKSGLPLSKNTSDCILYTPHNTIVGPDCAALMRRFVPAPLRCARSARVAPWCRCPYKTSPSTPPPQIDMHHLCMCIIFTHTVCWGRQVGEGGGGGHPPLGVV